MRSPRKVRWRAAIAGNFIGAFEDALVGTMALVPQRVDATGLPFLALGTQAAVMGTAFLTGRESANPEVWKTRVRAEPLGAAELMAQLAQEWRPSTVRITAFTR
jgi:hypothetical protein